MSEKALPPDETARVRAALKAIVGKAGTQTAAAELVKVKQTMISHVLCGGGCGYPTARKVAEYLRMDFDELVRGRGPKMRLLDLPGWDEAEAESRKHLAGVPDEVFRAVSRWEATDAPEGPPSEWAEELIFVWARIRGRRSAAPMPRPPG